MCHMGCYLRLLQEADKCSVGGLKKFAHWDPLQTTVYQISRIQACPPVLRSDCVVVYHLFVPSDRLENSITGADTLKQPALWFVFIADGGFAPDTGDGGQTQRPTVSSHRVFLFSCCPNRRDKKGRYYIKGEWKDDALWIQTASEVFLSDSFITLFNGAKLKRARYFFSHNTETSRAE